MNQASLWPTSKARAGSVAATVIGMVVSFILQHYGDQLGPLAGDVQPLVAGAVVGLITLGASWATREMHHPKWAPVIEDAFGVEPHGDASGTELQAGSGEDDDGDPDVPDLVQPA